MQTALHRSYGNPEHIRCLTVFHALVVNENQGALQRVGKFLDRRPYPVFCLLVLHPFISRLISPREHLHKRTDVVIAARSLIEAHHPVTTIPTLGIDGLVGCDRVEPGAKPSPILKTFPLQVNLQERGLKHILCHLGIAQIAAEVAKQFLFISMHERLKRDRIVNCANPTD